MVNKITKKAILKIKETVDAYEKEMTVLSEKIANIDEKYRKLAEKESEELRKSYAALEEEQEIWNSSLSRYDVDIVNEVLGETTDSTSPANQEATTETTSTVEENEQVVDTLFEENNVTDEPKDESLETDTTEDIPTEMFDSSSDEEEETEEVDSSEAWPDETELAETETETENTESISDSVMEEDEWPSMPEEWK